MRRFVVALFAVSAAVLAAGCGSSSDSSSGTDRTSTAAGKGPIVVGAAIAQTGILQPFDTPAFQALQLKVKELNAAGGIDGRKVELRVEDTKSDIQHTAQVAKDLVSRGTQIMIVSCDFDFGSPAALQAQNAGLVSVSLCAQSPKFGVQGIGDKAYTIAQSANAEGAVLANLARKQGWSRASILLDDTLAYDKGVCDGFAKAFEQTGGEVVATNTFKNSDTSLSAQITRIKASPSDVVVLCSIPPGGASALRQLRAAGVDMPVVSGGGMDGTYWTRAVPHLNDFWVSTTVSIFGDDPSPRVNAFVKAFERETGSPPPTGLTATGYSVMEALAKAIEGAGGSVDGAALAEQLDSFRDEPLMIGPSTFTPEVHVELGRPQAILRYTDGKPKFVEQLPPAIDVGLAG